MTSDRENGNAIIRKAGDFGALGAIKLLSLCNLYLERCPEVTEFRCFCQK
jgi:hypothetical protein